MSLSWAQRQRLKFILARLKSDGEIKRRHLTEEFGITEATASADFGKFLRLNPESIVYNATVRAYQPGPRFVHVKADA